MAIKEKWMPSPNYSASRGPYNVLAFHTTEGAMTIEALGNWFAQSSAGCSSHHGADNSSAGLLGAYVYENHKAWTQGNANSYCLSLEMCAYASWSYGTWMGKNTLLNNAADWLRYMADKYNIPYTKLSNSQAQSGTVKGIAQHVNFGSMGSGHVDCGSGFPIDEVIKRAKGSSPSPTPSSGGIYMADVAYYEGKAYFAYIDPNGKVCCNGGVVDPSQSGAKGGCGIDIDPESGRKLITFINGSGKVCTYDQALGSSKWTWTDKKWSAKA
jgi:hypothetical protein